MGDRGRRRALDHFSVQRMTDGVESVYRYMADTPKSLAR